MNPICTTNASICRFQVFINGMGEPAVPYTPCFAENNSNYVREYGEFMDNMGYRFSNKGIQISKTEYGVDHCFFALDLTPHRGARDDNVVSLIKKGNMRVEVQFAQAPQHVLTCVMIAEFDSILKIDKDRNVFLNYTPSA